MKHSYQATFILVFILFCNICLAQKQDRTNQINKVDSLLHHYYQKNNPGVALAIIEQGKTIYSGQRGISNMEYGIPITDSTAFHIASVSKQFTAYLAVLLEKEGKLSLHDDIRKYLPELKDLPYKITLRQLANHTHGLSNLYELAQLKGIEPGDKMTHKEIVEMLLHIKQVNFKPGEQYQYNNTGFVLLAEIIERLTGKPFQEILKDKIFIPLQMNNSSAVNTSSLIIKNKAYSYRLKNGKYENYAFNMMANGSSGISTTINDLSKWAITMQYPSVENKEILDEMLQPTILNSGETIRYGLGLESKTYKGLELVFHGGGDAGYRSYILTIPKYKFSVVMLGNNNDFKPFQLVYEIVDLFLKEYEKENPSLQKTSYTTQELKAFEGTYEMFPGSFFTIIAENNSLYYQAFGTQNKMVLPIIGDGVFANPNLPISYFSFDKSTCNFHIADFTYPSKRVNVNLPKPNEMNLAEFAGIYRNEEFNTEYELVIKNSELIAQHSLNNDIALHPLTKNSFYSNEGFFGKLSFSKNKEGKIIGFSLSGQNLHNILFTKIK
ncbi:serine hydrolase domain-containing protein [Chryseobacterium polytrichastri]|uniref:CubicO group peptidase, beta-lactamase class C family n=1 Tax=Chryseobacterium polytrichastri TaxID=1302687 RepID=A0A1M6RNT8_9FLAO|nr:serine hydrolase domain-containing protein [Chryseobacterium polytrichastri]SHK34119.1 CubicO group peptidase, beta-lactamase class C family [Chryseobacterium polytrichastri]